MTRWGEGAGAGGEGGGGGEGQSNSTAASVKSNSKAAGAYTASLSQRAHLRAVQREDGRVVPAWCIVTKVSIRLGAKREALVLERS